MSQPALLMPKSRPQRLTQRLPQRLPKTRTLPTWSLGLSAAGQESIDFERVDLLMEQGRELVILGTVAAGLPIEALEDRETIRVPAHMTRKASYALRVRGHSMTEDQIQDGDIIIVEQRQSADNGETVVAQINGDQVTLKRFFIERDGIRLQPAHPEMAPIYLRHEEIEILGIVTGVMRLTAQRACA